jgi:hypothetical protein
LSSRFNFTSPGAAASTALSEFLIQRRVAQQQERMQALQQAQFEAQQNERARQAERQAAMDANANADRLASIYSPSADLSPEIADAMQRGGYAVEQRNTLAARSLPIGDVAGQELPSTPYRRRQETHVESLARQAREAAQAERDEQRTFRNDQAEAQRAFQGAQADANRQARAEQAAADRELKALIAQMSQSNNLETRALGNELKRLQIQAAEDKLTTAREGREKTASDARTSTQTALDLVGRLQSHSGMGKATGAYELRGFTQDAQDFNALRDQLVATLTLPNLGALKGPMSDKDVAFVKSISTRLANTRMSEAETRKALTEAQTFLRSKLGDGGGSNGGRDLGKDW